MRSQVEGETASKVPEELVMADEEDGGVMRSHSSFTFDTLPPAPAPATSEEVSAEAFTVEAAASTGEVAQVDVRCAPLTCRRRRSTSRRRRMVQCSPHPLPGGDTRPQSGCHSLGRLSLCCGACPAVQTVLRHDDACNERLSLGCAVVASWVSCVHSCRELSAAHARAFSQTRLSVPPGTRARVCHMCAAQVAPLLGSSAAKSDPEVNSYPLEPADTSSSDVPAPATVVEALGNTPAAPPTIGGGDGSSDAAREGYVLLGSDSAPAAGADVTDTGVPPQVRTASRQRWLKMRIEGELGARTICSSAMAAYFAITACPNS